LTSPAAATCHSGPIAPEGMPAPIRFVPFNCQTATLPALAPLPVHSTSAVPLPSKSATWAAVHSGPIAPPGTAVWTRASPPAAHPPSPPLDCQASSEVPLAEKSPLPTGDAGATILISRLGGDDDSGCGPADRTKLLVSKLPAKSREIDFPGSCIVKVPPVEFP